MNLDHLDLKILGFLKKNARASYKEIGAEIGLTSPAVAQRIQKMEQEGVIKRYKIELDYVRLGIGIKAVITVKFDHKRYRLFLKEFLHREEVLSVHRITGEDCVLMHTQFKDNTHLLNFIDQLTAYGSTKTNIILEEIWCD